MTFRSTLFASLALLPAIAPTLALAGDISLDNVALPTGDASKITFKHIDLIDTNLTPEEANKLFSGALPRDAVADLLGKLKAARIAVTEATASSDKPGSILFRDLKAEGVDQGSAAHLAIGGVDADIPGDTGGNVTLRGQPLTLDGVRVQHLAEAIRSGEATTADIRVAKLSWSGFDLTAPDKETPAGADGGNLIKMHMNSAQGEQTFVDDLPAKMSFAANGISVTMPKASQAGAMMTALGYDKLEATMKFAGAYDSASKTFTLDDYSIDFDKLGSIGLSGKFGGLEKTVFGGDAAAKNAAMQAAEIQEAKLRIVNAGALEKAVALTALSKNQPPEAIKAQWSMIAAQAPMLAPNIPAATTIAQGLVKFIANGKTLTLSLNAKPPAPKLSQLQEIKDPALLSARFDVKAEADGAAAPLAAPAQPAAQAPVEPSTPKLTGLTAWNALVGNTVSGKDTDGLPLSEFYAPDGTVKQLDDDETATGKWAARGSKVCFIFPGEKEESCYGVEVSGDIATFIDEDGDGKRYTILKGNAKNL